MKEAFVGFDSAWVGESAGAISYAVFRETNLENVSLPRVADFADAARIIEYLQGQCDDVLVAIDQPIIVNNQAGSRPVDPVAGSLMGRLRSGTQPANRNKDKMFGDNAPIWRFINRIKPTGMTCRALKDFEAARMATGETHLIEVYPALAWPALDQFFMDRGSAPRYNPASTSKNFPFALDDWRRVCELVHDCAGEFNLQLLSQWANEMIEPWDSPERPKKPHQDKVDAALCLLICLQWRRGEGGHELHAIGDLDHGYIVTPVCDATREILEAACGPRNVDFH